ncbi:MAG TPA: serine hydrolase domain-containing protein, partial [Longimicrobium sp.]|nr:serine hydrolase domain-containing protein [Longimicrobium sp.]
DGEIVWAEGFGWADVAQRQPVTPTTLFRVGSVGKPMTAAAVGLLHQRGRLKLDEPVRTYVPEFPEKPWPVTTRQLLGHLGGVRDYAGESEVMGRPHCADVREGLPIFASDPLIAAPGTRYAYTSFGYVLASAALQAAAGEPYAEFMRREIFAPLGMERTFPESAGQPVPDRATFYVRGQSLTPAPHDDDSCVLAGGGFLSTPSDLVRFGFGMLGGELLLPETVRMLWTPQRLDSGASTGYGMGWFVRAARLQADAPVVPMFGHGGSSVGAKTSFMVLPEQRMVVAVVTNVTGADVLSLASRLALAFHTGGQR